MPQPVSWMHTRPLALVREELFSTKEMVMFLGSEALEVALRELSTNSAKAYTKGCLPCRWWEMGELWTAEDSTLDQHHSKPLMLCVRVAEPERQ